MPGGTSGRCERRPPAAYRSLAVGPEGRRHQDQEVSTHSALPADASRRYANNGLSKPPGRLASDDWQDSGLVFTTALGTAMDAANVWRDLRRALGLVPGIDPGEWTPRELPHSFVSVLSDVGIPVEQIAQLVGHRSTTVTELVYRHLSDPSFRRARPS
jgi:integrase